MKIKVEESEELRLDQYLSDYFEDVSRSKLSKLIKSKDVKVNNNFEKSSYIIKDNDIIDINLDALKLKPIEAQDLNIEIVFEDDDIAIINKPKGIISHPTNTIRENTVVNFLLHAFNNLSYINGDERPGIVHRLDKDTSGLMIIAKTDLAMEKLKLMFKKRSIIKKYRTIAFHRFNNLKGSIDAPIGRSLNNRKLMSVVDNGRESKTEYKVLEQNKEFAFLDINLLTGRTHQIRVHLSYINHPILGDKEYCNIPNSFNIEAQLLQAYYLEFNHPIINKKLTFEIPMYPEFKKYYNIIFKEN